MYHYWFVFLKGKLVAVVGKLLAEWSSMANWGTQCACEWLYMFKKYTFTCRYLGYFEMFYYVINTSNLLKSETINYRLMVMSPGVWIISLWIQGFLMAKRSYSLFLWKLHALLKNLSQFSAYWQLYIYPDILNIFVPCNRVILLSLSVFVFLTRCILLRKSIT